MLILGLLLIIAAAAVTVSAVYDAGETATVEILGRQIETTVAGVFAVGAATTLLFLLGVWLLMGSMGRARRKRVERKEARARQRESVSRLEDERTALRAENERLNAQLRDERGTSATAGEHTTTETTPTATHNGDHAAARSNGTSHDPNRVVDHRTDLTTPESSTQGRHRDSG